MAALGTPESMKPKAEDRTLRNKVSLHNNDVRVKDSFYDQPDHAVIPATSEDNIIDAFKAAEEQAKLVEDRLRSENIRHTEAAMKSTLRGEDALRKVRLDNSKATLESHLEVLRRKEFARQNAGSMAATAKRLATSEATKQFQMEQIVADAIGGAGYSVAPDPELDISSATDSSAPDPQNIPYTHYDLHEEKAAQRDDNSVESNLPQEPFEVSLPEVTQVPSILKTSNSAIPRENHSVRFNDEQKQLLEMFEAQKREMELILEQAKIEHEENLQQLEQAQASTLEGDLSASQNSSASNNSSIMTQRVIENLDAIKSYQNKLIQKYSSGSENNATSSTATSSHSLPSLEHSSAEHLQQNASNIYTNTDNSIQVHEVNSSNLSKEDSETAQHHSYIGLPPYTPPTFHESMFDATKLSHENISRQPSMGLIDIDQELRQEQDIIGILYPVSNKI